MKKMNELIKKNGTITANCTISGILIMHLAFNKNTNSANKIIIYNWNFISNPKIYNWFIKCVNYHSDLVT